mgnify:CR=1 FL=1
MPVIEIIALFFGTISFVMTLVSFANVVQSLPDIDSEALTNMLFSAIVCLTCVGVVAYAEIVK